MPLTKRLTIETVNLDDETELRAFYDQVIQAGMQRVAAEQAKLRAQGLLDEKGNVVLPELLAERQPDAERDFGG